MITDFRLGDALRCVLVNAPGGPNLAAPTESVVRCRPLHNSAFWRDSLARNQNRVTVGDWKGIDLSGLASAKMRCGVRAWEVDRLHLRDPEQGPDILEQVVEAAGSRGAERVFLRVPLNSPITKGARRAGFFPYYEEMHLTGDDLTIGSDGFSADLGGEEDRTFGRYAAEGRTEQDCHGLFQLYCAATPQQVRVGLGMTFDQWCDSQEHPQPRRQETVLNLDGKIVGWQKRDLYGKTAAGQVSAHPAYPDVTPHLIRMCCNTRNWLVPSYQENAADLLTRQGLNEAGRYTMLIKTMTVPVMGRELSYVEA